jgi:hypothetical protein
MLQLQSRGTSGDFFFQHNFQPRGNGGRVLLYTRCSLNSGRTLVVCILHMFCTWLRGSRGSKFCKNDYFYWHQGFLEQEQILTVFGHSSDFQLLGHLELWKHCKLIKFRMFFVESRQALCMR